MRRASLAAESEAEGAVVVADSCRCVGEQGWVRLDPRPRAPAHQATLTRVSQLSGCGGTVLQQLLPLLLPLVAGWAPEIPLWKDQQTLNLHDSILQLVQLVCHAWARHHCVLVERLLMLPPAVWLL
jgi:hypothetical protein